VIFIQNAAVGPAAFFLLGNYLLMDLREFNYKCPKSGTEFDL